MIKAEIHTDDYGDMERSHADALNEIEQLRIADFAAANDILMRLQDRAYQLGVERGKKMQEPQP